MTLQEPAVEAPLDAMVRTRIGAPADPAHVAAKENEAIAECGRAKGVNFPDSAFASNDLPNSGPAVLGGYIEPARALIRDLDAKAHDPAQSGDASISKAQGDLIARTYIECVAEVGSVPPTPEIQFWEWYSQQTQDMAAQMQADPRKQTINEQAEQCFAEAGYPDDSWWAEDQLYYDAATQVESDFLAERLTAAEANARLDEIEAKSNVMIAAVSDCYENQLTADAQLYAEYQAAWIEENGEVLNEQLALLEQRSN